MALAYYHFISSYLFRHCHCRCLFDNVACRMLIIRRRRLPSVAARMPRAKDAACCRAIARLSCARYTFIRASGFMLRAQSVYATTPIRCAAASHAVIFCVDYLPATLRRRVVDAIAAAVTYFDMVSARRCQRFLYLPPMPLPLMPILIFRYRRYFLYAPRLLLPPCSMLRHADCLRFDAHAISFSFCHMPHCLI